MKINKLGDALKFVKKALKTPYHFYHYSENKLILIILEDKHGKRLSFSGVSMFNAVEEAITYVENEIAAGTIKELTNKKETTCGIGERGTKNDSNFKKEETKIEKNETE